MSDCGCDKARRDLEEYLRNEVCKTEHNDIRECVCISLCVNDGVVAGLDGDRAGQRTDRRDPDSSCLDSGHRDTNTGISFTGNTRT